MTVLPPPLRSRTIRCLAFAAILCCSTSDTTAQPPAAEVSLSEYVAWIERVRADVDGGALDPAAIPQAWRVQTRDGGFDVSNEWLIRDLGALQRQADPAARARVRENLAVLGREASSSAAPPEDRTEARARLTEILSRREFQGIRGPTWRDRLRQQILRFIVGLLERLFGSSAVPTVSNILIYLLIAAALVVVALWAFRSLARAAALESIASERVAVSARSWTLWLADAERAAGRGEWREAVRLAYWCAVSFLEFRGAWRPDRARTPREYLRLIPASNEHRPALAALTRTFEHVWYGTDLADAKTFDEARASLEKMGCRPD